VYTNRGRVIRRRRRVTGLRYTGGCVCAEVGFVRGRVCARVRSRHSRPSGRPKVRPSWPAGGLVTEPPSARSSDFEARLCAATLDLTAHKCAHGPSWWTQPRQRPTRSPCSSSFQQSAYHWPALSLSNTSWTSSLSSKATIQPSPVRSERTSTGFCLARAILPSSASMMSNCVCWVMASGRQR
jgi:hypothetical protein